MKRFGLIGERLEHSFSPSFFKNKFEDLELKEHSYVLFEMADIDEAKVLFKDDSIKGLNVTIPYKESIIPLLDELDPIAREIGSVNTICFRNGRTVGHNTDLIGFRKSLNDLIGNRKMSALVFGSGGAARTVRYVLNELGLEFETVSRRGVLNYGNITEEHITKHKLLINTTPVGTYPNEHEVLPLPYSGIDRGHYAFDLIYNPDPSSFMKACQEHGATVKSGLEMLELQAEASWELWK